MGLLHEVVAVEGDLKATAQKIISETVNTFSKKDTHFFGLTKAFQPDKEDEKQLVQPEEVKPLEETVPSKLGYMSGHVTKYLDALYQKESANTQAKADIILPEGEVLEKDVPATALLALEGKLKDLRQVYESIPTLTPGDEWAWDEQNRNYKTESIRVRTEAVPYNHVKTPATDKHPAQVEVMKRDERVGVVKTVKVSGAITPAEKSDVLARVDTLVRAVKQARQRANTTQAPPKYIGEKLFKFIDGKSKNPS